MSTWKKCLVILSLAGVGAGVLQLQAEPAAIYSNRSVQETERVLAGKHLLVFTGSPLLSAPPKEETAAQAHVDQSDVAAARAILASQGMLAAWKQYRGKDPQLATELNAALCRLPGVHAAAVLRDAKGVLVMLECSPAPQLDAIRALASLAHGTSRENVKILSTDGKDLAPPASYSPLFYSNSDPEESEELRLSVQLLADEAFGAEVSKVFAAVKVPIQTKGRLARRRADQRYSQTVEFLPRSTRKLHVGFDPAATVAPEQRQKFLDQLKLRFNYDEKRGDALAFVDLPYAYRKVTSGELETLRKDLSVPTYPLSYSFVLGLLALAPAGLSLGLISYDLLRKHQVRASG